MLPHRESADKVVLHTGKYEELIVCSHEIAASTAQLVAASKVIYEKNTTTKTFAITALLKCTTFYYHCFGSVTITQQYSPLFSGGSLMCRHMRAN